MITVITAAYEAAPRLPELIASLHSQSDRDFEWVVVDGGSGDGTQEVLGRVQNLNLRWVSEPDFGIYHALNKALEMARGEFYLVVGADDTLAPDAIRAFSQAAHATGADVIAARVQVGDRVIRPRRRFSWARSGPPYIAAHSVGTLIRRSLHEEIGPYSRRYPIAADTLFLLHAGRGGKRFVCIDEVVGRFGSGGVSSCDRLGALCESWRASVEVRGRYWLQLPLFIARLLANGPTIAAQARARRLARR